MIKMIEAILNLLIIWTLATAMFFPIILLKSNQDLSRKWTGIVWIFLSFVPLAAALINRTLQHKNAQVEIIVYTLFAIPIIIPSLYFIRGGSKSISVILAYSWIALSITGLFFLLFTLGTPLIIIKFIRGRCSFPDFLPGIMAGELWTIAALFIFGSTIHITRKIKEDLNKIG